MALGGTSGAEHEVADRSDRNVEAPAGWDVVEPVRPDRNVEAPTGWDVVEPVRPEPFLAPAPPPPPRVMPAIAPPTSAEPLPIADALPAAEPVPAPEPPPEAPAAPAPMPPPQEADAPRAERVRDRTPVRSALTLLLVAALAGAGLAATVAIGFGVIWFALRRIVGG